jgi:PAS domain S-box-containing protein
LHLSDRVSLSYKKSSDGGKIMALSRRTQRNFLELRHSRAVQFGLPLLLSLFATGLFVGLRDFLSPTYFVTYFVPVVICALMGGFWSGALATVLSAVFAVHWIIPPASSFHLGTAEIVQLTAFAVTCLTLSWISARLLDRFQNLQADSTTRDIVDRISDSFVALDSNWRFVYLNPATEKILGRGIREIRGREFWEIFPETVGSELETTMRTAMREQRPATYLGLLPSLGRWLSTSLHPSAAGLTLYSRDVTDERNARARVQSLETERLQILERSEAQARHQAEELTRANAELAQFGYMASHDLKEPLRMVSNYVQLLEKRYLDQLDDRARSYIKFASDGAKRMHELLNAALTFSRLSAEPIEVSPVSMHEVVHEALSNLEIKLNETQPTIHIGSLPVVDANRKLAVLLFQSLFSNALKYHSERSLVLEVDGEESENGHVVCVRDNGIGIEAAHHEKIFEMFKRLHGRERYPGNGIGLALCKKIMERHGGKISLRSVPGLGSTFVCTFPSSLASRMRDKEVGGSAS